MSYKSDIEIAREARKRPIIEIGEKIGIGSDDLLPYGRDKAKVSQSLHRIGAGPPEWQADPCHRDQPDTCG